MLLVILLVQILCLAVEVKILFELLVFKKLLCQVKIKVPEVEVRNLSGGVGEILEVDPEELRKQEKKEAENNLWH